MKKIKIFVISLVMLVICCTVIIQSITPNLFAKAETCEAIELNELVTVYLGWGTSRSYTITLTDTSYYVVETTGTYDIALQIEGLSVGDLEDDDSGIGINACIGFVGELCTITITVYSLEDWYGSTTLQIRKQQALLSGFVYSNMDTTQDLIVPNNVLNATYSISTISSSSTTSYDFTNLDNRNLQTYNSEIFFFSGHSAKDNNGTSGYCVVFPNDDILTQSSITNMCNTKVAVWAACYSASTNNYYNQSFIGKSVSCGAKSAVGWPSTISSSSSKKFTNEFFTALSQGYTVAQAANKGKNKIWWIWDNVRDYMIAGDSSTIINTPNTTRVPENTDQLVSEFHTRTSKGEWISFLTGADSYRYYKTINGQLTNDFYDICIGEDCICNISHSGYYIEQQPILQLDQRLIKCAIDNRFKDDIIREASHIVYVLNDDIVVPYLIRTIVFQNDKSLIYQKEYCTCLVDGCAIDYEYIC